MSEAGGASSHVRNAANTAKKSVSPQARAVTKNARVAEAAGTEGMPLPSIPNYPIRTDLVDPLLAFAVYGTPSPQGSKSFGGFRGGKPVLLEQSKGVDPWRKTVRRVALQAIRDWSARTGGTWAALDEPVMVSAVVTLPDSKASQSRGDVFSYGTPDLDKLQRAIGDALSPTPLKDSDGGNLSAKAKKQAREKMMAERRRHSVLHDDSRIVVWDQCMKVYPGTMPLSLAHPGVVIRIWRMADLHQVSRTPIIMRGGRRLIRAADLRKWATPSDGQTWEAAAAEAWRDPGSVLDTPLDAPINLKGRMLDEHGVRTLLCALATGSPDRLLAVTLSP